VPNAVGTPGLEAKLARRWAGRGFWALADRGLFSISNFVLNILLARWLSPEGYGSFAVAFSVFLLLAAVHAGLLTEPMLVFGPARHADRFHRYFGELLILHAAIVAVESLVLFTAGLVVLAVGGSSTASALLALSVACPLVLLLWLGRLACYVTLRPRPAAVSGIAYFVVLLAGTLLLRDTGRLTTASALLLMGCASVLPAVGLILRLKPQWSDAPEARRFRRTVRDDHWAYGRWAVSTGVLTWLPGQVYYIVLPFAGGLAATASLRALMNLIMPIVQGYSALSVLLTSVLAGRRGRFREIVRWSLVGFGTGAVLYWGALGLGRHFFLHLLYGGRYADTSALVWLVGLIPVIGVGSTVLAPALRALERPDRVFVAYAVSTTAALTVGLALTIRGGPAGAAVGILVSTILVAAILSRELRRIVRNGDMPVEEPARGDAAGARDGVGQTP